LSKGSLMKKKALSKGEKKLLTAVILFVVMIGGIGYWFYSININPVVSIPTPAMPEPNALNAYLNAYSLIVPSIYTPAGSHPSLTVDRIGECIHAGKIGPVPRWGAGAAPPRMSDMQALLAKNAPVIAKVQQGFACEYMNTPARSFSQLPPYYAKMRGLTRVLVADGDVKCASGDWDDGADRYLDIMRVGSDIPRGGPMIAMLIGVAIQSIGRWELWPALDHVSGAGARISAQRLEAMATRQVSYAEVLQEEKYLTQAALMEMFNTPNWRSAKTLESLLGLEGKGTRVSRAVNTIWMQTVNKRAVMRNYSKNIDALIAVAKKPYPAMLKTLPLPKDPFCRMLLPVSDKAWLKYAINQTQNDILMLCFALRAYKADHGKYPADLKKLTPAYLKEIPADIFTAGNPLGYKVTGKTYTLYSIGPDGKDDGGAPSMDGQKGATGRNISMRMESKGDIVAGVNIR